MTPLRPRFSIRGLMTVVAGYALAFAALGPGLVILLSILLAGLAGLVVGLARVGGMTPGRAATWVAAAYPWFFLAAFYLTWATSWATLGHRPRPAPDDPGNVGGAAVVVDTLAVGLMVGGPFALMAAIGLTAAQIVLTIRAARPRWEDEVARLAFGPAASWFLAWLVFAGDAWGVLVEIGD